MAMMSALFHEGQAKERAAEERRAAKYGGEQRSDDMVDLSEESIPGVLMKKIVRPGNGEIPPVGSTVSRTYSLYTFCTTQPGGLQVWPDCLPRITLQTAVYDAEEWNCFCYPYVRRTRYLLRVLLRTRTIFAPCTLK